MSLSTGKISNSVLWLCMIITCVVFTVFYFSGTKEIPGSNLLEPKQTSTLLYWTYIVSFASISTVLLFSLLRFYKKWKEDPRSALKSLISVALLLVLFAFTFILGNGEPLKISGYEGTENTSLWLKLTDMWLYSIYILLILTITSVFAGIIWSYIKKIK